MKIPQAPPDFETLAKQLSDLDPEIIQQIFMVKPTDHKDRYLHWDQLKYRPAPDGLTSEQYWLGTKIARRALIQNLPLFDKQGQPFKFAIPSTLQRALHEIDVSAGGTIGMTEPLVSTLDRDMYLVRSLVEEAITSSQLEGASTSRKVAKEMLLSERKPRDRSEQMIVNNFIAMRFVLDNKDEVLTPELIRELHRLVTQNALDDPQDAGRLRSNADDVRVFDITQDRILHTPPDADELADRLQILCDFANQSATSAGDEAVFIHPIVRAILLHFMLAYDHPFVDGNGRTARALFFWFMANRGYWLVEYLSISRIIQRAPAQYGYAFLYTETDDNDTTYFLAHQLDVIRKAITDLQSYLERKTSEFHTAVALLEQADWANKLNHRQIKLLEHALGNPGAVYSIKEHQNLHRIAYQTARTDLAELAESFGLLMRIKKNKSFVYIAPADLQQRIDVRQNDK